jgi:hypothetical protein
MQKISNDEIGSTFSGIALGNCGIKLQFALNFFPYPILMLCSLSSSGTPHQTQSPL